MPKTAAMELVHPLIKGQGQLTHQGLKGQKVPQAGPVQPSQRQSKFRFC